MSGMQLSLHRLLPWVNGAVLHGDSRLQINRVHTDSRSLEPGDLFVALRGDRFDAGQFIDQAKDLGAVAVMCDATGLAKAQAAGLAAVVVADTRLALGQLAAGWRAQFDLPLIAVTGSNGKTTVTQMLASILKIAQPNASLATHGNMNNDIGVPLTLLRLRVHHAVAVVELGMNHPGEISHLAAMTRPTVALVNNAQREHQEYMGSVEAVARENGAVIGFLNSKGIAVYPIDDEYAPLWQNMAASREVVTFGLTSGDVRSSDTVWSNGAWNFELQSKSGFHPCRIQVAGRHNVKNAVAAAACALSVGISIQDIAQGLHEFEPVKGRSRSMTFRDATHDITVVDDSYNANPDSVCAAIDVLCELPGPQLLVLGDMGEVGDQGPQFHTEVGVYARAKGLSQIFSLGTISHHTTNNFSGGLHFEDMAKLQAKVMKSLPQFNSILVKGSRFMKMERVLDELHAHLTKGDRQHVA